MTNSILRPGYLRWDGTKYVLDPGTAEPGPAGPAGPAGPVGPQGIQGLPGASGSGSGGGMVFVQTFGDVLGSGCSNDVVTTVVGLQDRPIASTAPTTNQVLGWNGFTWLPMTVSGGGGGDGVNLELLGSPISGSPFTTLNFLGNAPKTITNAGGGVANITVTGEIVVQDNGSNIPNTPHSTFNFTGNGVTVTDAGSGVANITIPGGITVQNQGTNIANNPKSVLNFVGSIVTASDTGGDTAEISIVPGIIIQNGGTSIANNPHTTLDFQGGFISVVDAGSGVANINAYLSSSGSANAVGVGMSSTNATLNASYGLLGETDTLGRADFLVDGTTISDDNSGKRFFNRNSMRRNYSNQSTLSNLSVLGFSDINFNTGFAAMTAVGDILILSGIDTDGYVCIFGLDTLTNTAVNGSSPIYRFANDGGYISASMLSVRTNIYSTPYNGAEVDLIFIVSSDNISLGYLSNNGTFSISSNATGNINYTNIYVTNSSNSTVFPTTGTFAAISVDACVGNPINGFNLTTVPSFICILKDNGLYIVDSSGNLLLLDNTVSHKSALVDDDGFVWTHDGSYLYKWVLTWYSTESTPNPTITLPQSTISLFEPFMSGVSYPDVPGSFELLSTNGWQTINYTSCSGTPTLTFTGCTGGTGTTVITPGLGIKYNTYFNFPTISLFASVQVANSNVPSLCSDGKFIFIIVAGDNEANAGPLIISKVDRTNVHLVKTIKFSYTSFSGETQFPAIWDGQFIWCFTYSLIATGSQPEDGIFVYKINPKTEEILSIIINTGSVLPLAMTATDNGHIFVLFAGGDNFGLYVFGNDPPAAHFRSLLLDRPLTSGFQSGTLSLSSGTKTVNTGITINSANTQVIIILAIPTGTLGNQYQVTSITPGLPGTGSFTVNAINTSGAIVTTDNSTLNYLIFG